MSKDGLSTGRLGGLVCFVTGAAQGIGAGIAIEMARQGKALL
jgi:short-subunit dehydrogenase